MPRVQSPAAGRDHGVMGDEAGSEHGGRANQAVGIVRLHADCSTEQAFAVMHERATMSGLTMEEIIDAVVDGTIRFD
jgi:hypothetical protein